MGHHKHHKKESCSSDSSSSDSSHSRTEQKVKVKKNVYKRHIKVKKHVGKWKKEHSSCSHTA